MLRPETIQTAPKALLHDHLDGGLRPATVIDLAREYGHATVRASTPNMRTKSHTRRPVWLRASIP